MIFLVTGENIDARYLLPPDQTLSALEQAVVPSFQMLAQWEQEGRLKGGVFPGEQAGGFVTEANSLEEIDGLMNRLPFFGLVKWNVRPLMSMQSIAERLPQYIQDARNMMQQAGG